MWQIVQGKHLYLQSNIKPTQKTTVRQDSRIQGTSAGPTQRPNYAIPLLDWINERVRENDIILPVTEVRLIKGLIEME